MRPDISTPFCYNLASLVKQLNKAGARPPKSRQTADQVSELTTNRLSVYLRCLTELEVQGARTVSSQSLAEQFHLNAAQIRKDLAYFGEFGVRGVGYYVRDLKRHLRQILGLDRNCASASSAPATWDSRWRITRASGRKASRSLRCSTTCARRSGSSRARASLFMTSPTYASS